MWRRSAAARAVASASSPPTSRGTSREALRGSPGFTRSGREGEVEVAPGDEAAPLEDLAERARSSCPGRSSTGGSTSWPARRLRRDEPRRLQDRPEIRVLGLGDRRRDAHEHDVGRAEDAVGVRRLDDPKARARAPRTAARRSMSSIGERPAQQLRHPAGASASTPATSSPASTNAMASGQADVAQADDRDPRVARHHRLPGIPPTAPGEPWAARMGRGESTGGPGPPAPTPPAPRAHR